VVEGRREIPCSGLAECQSFVSRPVGKWRALPFDSALRASLRAGAIADHWQTRAAADCQSFVSRVVGKWRALPFDSALRASLRAGAMQGRLRGREMQA
jgi:hypothetical protein